MNGKAFFKFKTIGLILSESGVKPEMTGFECSFKKKDIGS